MIRSLLFKLGKASVVPESRAGPATSSNRADWLEAGLDLCDRGELKAALECFQRALEICHDDVSALVKQGEVQARLGADEDAADSFELALAFDANCVHALRGLAKVARKSAQYQEALVHLTRASQLAPHDAGIFFDLGLTQNAKGDTDAAISSYARALDVEPRFAAACVNLGLIYLSQRNDPQQAQRLFERAVALQPELVAAQSNLGLALQEQGDFEAALAHYEKLIAAYSEVVEYRWNRGIAHLSRGDFAAGWPDYELRNSRLGKSVGREFPLSPWDGTSLAGRNLLVYGEQGIGDEIMFASCIPDVLSRADSVVIECSVRLERLFERSFRQARIHGAPRDGNRDWLRQFPQLDTQIAVGSLPQFLRKRWADFPARNGYLHADAARVAFWTLRLAELRAGRHIGITWRGGTLKTRREARSLSLEELLPVLKVPGCHFVCLQDGDCGEEIAYLRREGIELHWWPEAANDFDEWAALISALDLVITVDTAAAHLTGALGRPLWVMLSASPEWRYLWRGDRMPWYPGARLFRQRTGGDWRHVVDSIVTELDRND